MSRMILGETGRIAVQKLLHSLLNLFDKPSRVLEMQSCLVSHNSLAIIRTSPIESN